MFAAAIAGRHALDPRSDLAAGIAGNLDAGPGLRGGGSGTDGRRLALVGRRAVGGDGCTSDGERHLLFDFADGAVRCAEVLELRNEGEAAGALGRAVLFVDLLPDLTVAQHLAGEFEHGGEVARVASLLQLELPEVASSRIVVHDVDDLLRHVVVAVAA